MAFEFVLISDEKRERILNHIKVKCNGRGDFICATTNWIHGVYDKEIDFFIVSEMPYNGSCSSYILIKGDEACFDITVRGERPILEMSRELNEYKEMILSGLRTYNDQTQTAKFKEEFSLTEDAYQKLQEEMEDRAKYNVPINSYEDAKALFYERKFRYDSIRDFYNKKTVADFNRFMSEQQRNAIVGKEYREIVERILVHQDWESKEGRDKMSEEYASAGFMGICGLDDTYSQMVFEAIKKGYENNLITCGFEGFVGRYVFACLKFYTDDLKDELKPIIDYICGDVRTNQFMFFVANIKKLEKLINGPGKGFQFVFTTDEMRKKMLNYLYLKGQLVKDKMNWATGVYKKDAGIFITQTYRQGPGREIYDEKQRYIAMMDDGSIFAINAVHKYTGNYVIMVPKEYEKLTNVIKEGLETYKHTPEYRRSLSDEEMQQVVEINDRMAKLVEKL